MIVGEGTNEIQRNVIVRQLIAVSRRTDPFGRGSRAPEVLQAPRGEEHSQSRAPACRCSS